MLRASHHAPPDPQWTPPTLGTVQVLSLGRPTTAATALWMRTVDRYVEGQVGAEDIASSVRTIGQLDPSWVAPWYFGVLMLPADTSTALEEQLLADAVRLHPEVPWFSDRLDWRIRTRPR